MFGAGSGVGGRSRRLLGALGLACLDGGKWACGAKRRMGADAARMRGSDGGSLPGDASSRRRLCLVPAAYFSNDNIKSAYDALKG